MYSGPIGSQEELPVSEKGIVKSWKKNGAIFQTSVKTDGSNNSYRVSPISHLISFFSENISSVMVMTELIGEELKPNLN